MMSCTADAVHVRACDVAGDPARVGDVVDAGAPLVLLVHGVQPDEVLLRVARHLHVAHHSMSRQAHRAASHAAAGRARRM